MRYFNTTGPNRPDRHYTLPSGPRLPRARGLIDQGRYFVVHAPRQTGKTTTLEALAQQLTSEGRYVALRFSCEVGEDAGGAFASAEEMILDAVRSMAAELGLTEEQLPPDPWPQAPEGRRLLAGLREWARSCPRPLVLFFDEIDALQGSSLNNVLRQLRDGYTVGVAPFPFSVVLCGMRNVRDYKIASGGAEPSKSASPFNISAGALRIGDFTADDVRELYGQHTAETGQEFTEEAIDRAFGYTQGQPWLTNALAAEIISEMWIEPSTTITADHIDVAKERLIVARATHLDSLAAKLNEPRVQRVIEPMIAGTLPAGADTGYNDDVTYVRDLGLIAPNAPVRMANPIYREVVVRVLGSGIEDIITEDPRDYVLPDGRLDFPKLLDNFACYWRENGEILRNNGSYHEAACQLVLMSYLTRLVNGGGYISREYAIGQGRLDLHIRWPYWDSAGQRVTQREVLELKVWRDGKDPVDKALAQLDDYLAKLGLDNGTLVIFDQRLPEKPIAERTRFEKATSPAGNDIYDPPRLTRVSG